VDTVVPAACLALRFAGVGKHLCIPDDPELLGGIDQVIPSWQYTRQPGQQPCNLGDECVVRVRHNLQQAGTFDIESAYLDEPLRGLPMASAVCAVVADLLEAFSEQATTPIVFHAGAFAIDNRLIAITGPGRAGKSTLISRLCAEPKLQVFCDDVLPVGPQGEGIALGVSPRLRLPLPADSSEAFRQMVARHLGPHDSRYGYVCPATLAPHGTHLPLSALVVLDRQADTPARLHHIQQDDGLFYALQQNMGHFESPGEALAATQALLGGITCVRLVYSNLEEAVQLLQQAFSSPTGIAPDVQVHDAGHWNPLKAAAPKPVNSKQIFSRTAGATLRRVGETAFLWRNGEHCVWRLNAVAQAVWGILEIPGTAIEVTEVLAEIFVQVPRKKLEADVRSMMGMMREEGFLVESPQELFG
jgi:hypothetical protein